MKGCSFHDGDITTVFLQNSHFFQGLKFHFIPFSVKLSLFFAILQIINGLDYFFNFRILFSLMRHVQFDFLFYISFLLHMTAGFVVMLKRRRVGSKKASIIIVSIIVGLTLFVGALSFPLVLQYSLPPLKPPPLKGQYYRLF